MADEKHRPPLAGDTAHLPQTLVLKRSVAYGQHFIDEPLAIYNIHDTNMTASMRLYFIKNLKLMKVYRGEVSWLLWVKRYFVCFLPVTASILYRKGAAVLSFVRHSQELA